MVWLYGIPGIVAGVVGLVLGILGRKKSVDGGAPTGMATTGIILSAIGIALGIFFFIACIICFAAIGAAEYGYYGSEWQELLDLLEGY